LGESINVPETSKIIEAICIGMSQTLGIDFKEGELSSEDIILTKEIIDKATKEKSIQSPQSITVSPHGGIHED
jgi:hypothetical protein